MLVMLRPRRQNVNPEGCGSIAARKIDVLSRGRGPPCDTRRYRYRVENFDVNPRTASSAGRPSSVRCGLSVWLLGRAQRPEPEHIRGAGGSRGSRDAEQGPEVARSPRVPRLGNARPSKTKAFPRLKSSPPASVEDRDLRLTARPSPPDSRGPPPRRSLGLRVGSPRRDLRSSRRRGARSWRMGDRA